MKEKLFCSVIYMLVYAWFGSSMVHAQNTITSREYVPNYLNSNQSIPSLSMGNTTLATRQDATDVFGNMAKLTGIDMAVNPYITIGYVPTYKNLYAANVSLGFKANDNLAFAIGGIMKTSGVVIVPADSYSVIMGTNKVWPGETEDSEDNMIAFGSAYRPGDSHFSVGLVAKYIGSSVMSSNTNTGDFYQKTHDNAHAMTGSFSLLYIGEDEDGMGTKLGLLLNNISFQELNYKNNNIRYFPTNLDFGGSYRFSSTGDDPKEFTLTGDLGKDLSATTPNPLDANAVAKYNAIGPWNSMWKYPSGRFSASIGAECLMHFASDPGSETDVCFRAGYNTSAYYRGPSVGGGISYHHAHANIGYLFLNNNVPNVLSQKFLVSLAFSFDEDTP